MKTIVLFSFLFLILKAFCQTTDPTKVVPMPLPELKKSINNSGSENHFIGYDIHTSIEHLIEISKSEQNEEISSSKPYMPENMELITEMIGQKNFSDLYYVSNTTQYPNSANCKLFIKFSSPTTYVASGVLLSKNVVLTAGHNLHDISNGGWATSIIVVPGYYDGNKPFGQAYMTYMYSWTWWTNDENLDWDMGIILLNQNIGKQTGWLGHGTYHNSFFQNNTFHNYSYPSEWPYDGLSMYYRYGSFDNVTDNIIYFNKRSYGGQSGSGSYWIDINGNPCVYSVLSHGNQNVTGNTRITSPKFDYINEVIEIGEPMSINGSVANNTKLKLYPNPVIDKINVEFSAHPEEATLSIFNILGQKILEETIEKNISKVEVPVNNLNPGYYILSISNGTYASTHRFVKS